MRNSAQVTWDDLRFVLAVAEHGSVSAAARALSVNHATVLRRIAAFEHRQGIRVFDRTPRGYQVSSDRRGLIEAMQSANDALSGVDRMIDAERPKLGAGIRITSTDTLAVLVLPPVLAGLSEHLGVPVDMTAANTHVDFDRMEAHITVRPAKALPDNLEGERIGYFWFCVYAASPDCEDCLGLSGPLARSGAAAWWRERSGECTLAADSFMTLATLAAEGRGRAILPSFVGETWPGLIRVERPKAIKPLPVWVASHVDFARSGRLVKARRYIRDQLADAPAFLEPKAQR